MVFLCSCLGEEAADAIKTLDGKTIGNIEKPKKNGTMKSINTKEVKDVHSIGKIDKNIYKCITDDIRTDQVVITDNQMQHILERHPDAYDRVIDYMENILSNPDYIIEDKHKDTGLVIKKIDSDNVHAQLVLRICTSNDNPEYKNSVISCWQISDKRLQNYLRNKRILYKKK